jgi:PST family polysaccharide transporter
MNLIAAKNKKRTLTNFFSLSLLQLGNYVLPMITLPIISRIIGPENYGVINYAFAFVGYFVLLINAGFDIYGSRLVTQHREDAGKINKVFSSITLAKGFLLLVASVLFACALPFIPQLRDEKLMTLFTFIICIGWVINPSWLYHGMQDSKKYAVFSFVSKLLFSFFVVWIVQERSDYLYHPLITSLAHLLVSAVSFYYAIRKYKLSWLSTGWSEIKETLNQNRKLSLIWWITNGALSTNIVLAGFYLSTLQIGYFSAALRIIIIIQSIIAMPLNTVLFPYIGDAFGKGYETGMERVHKTFPYLTWIAVGMSVATFLFAKHIIIGFYGNEFAEAVPLLRVFSGVLFFSTINSAFGQQVLLNLKRDSHYMKLVLCGFALNLVFLFLFIYLRGMSGAAWAWPASEVILFMVYFFYFRTHRIRVFKVGYYKPSFLLTNLFQMLRLRTLK